MKIKSIKLKDFLSHENTEINFNDENMILLQGQTQDERSNGAGKSAIGSAILFSLIKSTNKNVNNKDLIRHGENKANIELVLHNNSDEYIINRIIGNSVKTTFSKNNKEFTNHKSNELDDLIKQTFSITDDNMLDHQFASELNNRYMFYTPTQKLTFFEKVLRLEEQNEVYKKINSYNNQLQKQIDKLVSEISMLEEEINRTKQTLEVNYNDSIQQTKELISKYNSELEEKKIELEKYTEQHDNLQKDIQQQKITLKNEIDVKYKEKTKDIISMGKEYESKIKELKSVINEKNVYKTKVYQQIDLLNDKVDSEKQKLQALLINKNSFENKIQDLSDLISNKVCPVCKRPFDNKDIENYKQEIENYKTQISSLQQEYNTKLNKINNYKQNKLQEFNSLIQKTENEINELNSQINQFQEKIYEIKNKVAEIKNELTNYYNNEINKMNNELSKISLQINSIKSNITQLNSIIDNYNKQIKMYEQKIKDISTSEDINKITNIKLSKQQELDELKEESEITEKWSKIFSPKSPYRTSIIEQYFNILSNRINNYANRLFEETIDFQFMLDTEKNVIDEVIIRDGYVNRFHSLSQGEKRKIEISVMLAFYEIIANSNPNNLQFMLLDEVLDGLDEVTIEQVIPLLKEFAETYDIQLFFISNIPVNKNYFDRIITVRKENGISYIN